MEHEEKEGRNSKSEYTGEWKGLKGMIAIETRKVCDSWIGKWLFSLGNESGLQREWFLDQVIYRRGMFWSRLGSHWKDGVVIYIYEKCSNC